MESKTVQELLEKATEIRILMEDLEKKDSEEGNAEENLNDLREKIQEHCRKIHLTELSCLEERKSVGLRNIVATEASMSATAQTPSLRESTIFASIAERRNAEEAVLAVMQEAEEQMEEGLLELLPMTKELMSDKLQRLESMGWSTSEFRLDVAKLVAKTGSESWVLLGSVGCPTLTKTFPPREQGSPLTPKLGSVRTVSLQGYKLAFSPSGQEVSARFRSQEEHEALLNALRGSKMRNVVQKVAVEALAELKSNLDENKRLEEMEKAMEAQKAEALKKEEDEMMPKAMQVKRKKLAAFGVTGQQMDLMLHREEPMTIKKDEVGGFGSSDLIPLEQAEGNMQARVQSLPYQKAL